MSVDEDRYLYEHRMPESELVEKAREALENAGIGNRTHARLLHSVCPEVMESVNPLFAQLLPIIVPTTNRAWLKAYSLVVDFLTQNELELTLETFETELVVAQFPGQIPSESGLSFGQLVSSIPEPLPFRERVRRARPVRKQKKLTLKQTPPQKRKATSKATSPTGAKATVLESDDGDVVIEKIIPPK
jgi:hypothetical protein